MSAWNLAIGNLAPAKPQVKATSGQLRPAPQQPRRKTTPSFCPHCGQRVRSPDGPRPWTTAEDAVLVERVHAGVKPTAIAEELERAPSSINSRINTLGIEKYDASRVDR